MNFTERVSDFLKDELHIDVEHERFLLAVSGGIDSMAMLQTFHQLKFKFEVAHCNFQLRGKESDADQKLVARHCQELNVKIHEVSFDTAKFAEDNKLSIQEAARQLRYDFFHQLLADRELKYIATAHHLDDSIETFFINLFRGSGPKGLRGIPTINKQVIRPFNKIRKNEIREFVSDNNIEFREDSSNSSNSYLRNAIRNKLLPQISKIKPDVDEVVINQMELFSEVHSYLSASAEKQLSYLLQYDLKSDSTNLKISELQRIEGHKYLLHYWLSPFGFNSSDVKDIYLGLQNSTKASYFSQSHELLRDHGVLTLRVITPPAKEINGRIDENTAFLDLPLKMKIEKLPVQGLEIDDNPRTACFDLDLLKYPLVVRKWQFGDYFYPLGMQNRKKLSDFFTDKKVPTTVKERTYVLVSDREVAWVIGQRIDNRFKINNNTRRVVKFILD